MPNLDPSEAKRPTRPGQSYQAELTFSGGAPAQFIVAVGDYAGNMRYYQVDTTASGPVPVTPAPKPADPAGTGTAQPAAAPEGPTPTPTAVPTAAPAVSRTAGRAPRTADDLPLTALYVVLGFSAAGLLVLCIVRRRRK